MIHLAKTAYTKHRDVLHAYLSMISGSVVRLVLSLVYFICIANVLSISEFGLFATASATGIMVSRALAFGFMSPLYRIATVKPLLVGTYTLGFLVGAILSLPLIAALCTAVYLMIFNGDMGASVFARFMVAEILCWRGIEVVVIVLNGLGRFARGSILVVVGTALRTAAAFGFVALSFTSLDDWSSFYLVANAISLLIAIVLFYPRVKLRWQPTLYMRRWADSVSVACAEILFYIQSEFDKLVVLAIGGPAASGLYAIIMRLADLTALPVRSFNMLLVQKIMRTPGTIRSWRTRIVIECAIAGVSVAAIGAMGTYLWVFPRGLGNNVSQAAPYVLAILLVPAFRNLVEYHSELLYATGKTVRRMANLAIAGLLKIGLLSALLNVSTDIAWWAPMLNGLFFALYAASFVLTYTTLRHAVRRTI